MVGARASRGEWGCAGMLGSAGDSGTLACGEAFLTTRRGLDARTSEAVDDWGYPWRGLSMSMNWAERARAARLERRLGFEELAALPFAANLS